MKLLLMGDLHLTSNIPSRRLDSYEDSLFDKLSQIHDIAIDNGCSIIIQPGDFFDSFRVGERLKVRVMWFLKELAKDGIRVFTIPGQHDMKYRDYNLTDTSLGVLQAGGLLDVVMEEDGSPLVQVYNNKEETICVIGSPYGKYERGVQLAGNLYKKVVDENNCSCSVLMLHHMIIDKDLLWSGQKDFEYGRKLLKRTEVDLVVCGDNHQSFSIINSDGILVNCGSLMRSSISQIKHRPVVYVYDTQTKLLKSHYLSVAPAEVVFDLQEEEDISISIPEMDEFLQALSQSTQSGFDFFQAIELYLQQHEEELKEGTITVIKEVVNAVRGGDDHVG